MHKLKIPGFKLIGLALGKKTTNDGGQSNADCGSLWQKFEAEKIRDQIPDKSDDEIYALYFDYEGDHTKPFSYFIGCKVKDSTRTPEGMVGVIIPKQNYIKVIARGELPYCIADSWKEIWNSNIDRAYGYDFEIYDERSKDWSDARVDIFISTH